MPLEAGDEEVFGYEEAGGTAEAGDIASGGDSASTPSSQPRANDSQTAAQDANTISDAQSSPSPASIDASSQAQQAQAAGQVITPPATSANYHAGEGGSPVSIPPGSLAAQSAAAATAPAQGPSTAEGQVVAMDTTEEAPAPFSVFASGAESMFANVGRPSEEDEVRRMALEAERQRQAKRRAVEPEVTRHFIPSNRYIPNDTGDAQPDFSVRNKVGHPQCRSINEDVFDSF